MGLLLSGLLAVFVDGCAGVMFNEADNGRTEEMFMGTSFAVFLPTASQDRRPEMMGTIIRFLGCHQDELKKGEVFEFRAAGLGEDEIRIPLSSRVDYVLHMKIKSPSDEPSVLMHEH